MDEIRRPDDDELCGFVTDDDRTWRALTVFGGELGRHADRDAAVDHVLTEGLASLAERWTLRRGDGPDDGRDDEVVCILEANADEVTVGVGYYATSGVPRLTIARSQLTDGTWELRR